MRLLSGVLLFGVCLAAILKPVRGGKLSFYIIFQATRIKLNVQGVSNYILTICCRILLYIGPDDDDEDYDEDYDEYDDDEDTDSDGLPDDGMCTNNLTLFLGYISIS